MKFLIMIFIVINLYASIEVQQNIKALYRGVDLTDNDIEYIKENKYANTQIFKKILTKKIKRLKLKNLQEKNVVSFILLPNGEVEKIRFLQDSNNYKFDKLIKNTIIKNSKYFVKPQNKVEIRFIVSYENARKNIVENNNQSYKRKEHYIPISKGTTRFEYSSKEYVRVFETSEDGFVNLTLKPTSCARIRLLTNKNRKISTGIYPYSFNKEIPKGKYKLLLKIKKTCDVSIQYL